MIKSHFLPHLALRARECVSLWLRCIKYCIPKEKTIKTNNKNHQSSHGWQERAVAAFNLLLFIWLLLKTAKIVTVLGDPLSQLSFWLHPKASRLWRDTSGYVTGTCAERMTREGKTHLSNMGTENKRLKEKTREYQHLLSLLLAQLWYEQQSSPMISHCHDALTKHSVPSNHELIDLSEIVRLNNSPLSYQSFCHSDEKNH